MKKALSIIVLAAVAASMASCGSKAEPTEPAETTTTTTAAAAETTTVTTPGIAEVPTAPEETTAEAAVSAEAAEETPAQTTTAGDLDLDAMMSSIEAEIPEITSFTGIKDINITVSLSKNDVPEEPKTTTTTAKAAAKTTTATTKAAAKTTTTTTAPKSVSTAVNDMFSFNFDGVTYKLPITGSELPLPAGWTDITEAGRNERIFEKSGFKGCHIEELHRGGNTLNGVYVYVVNDFQEGKPVPALSMMGGITWGSTVEQIKAVFGEPKRESSFNQYNTVNTALFYSSAEGDTMVLYVLKDCGLACIELYRY